MESLHLEKTDKDSAAGHPVNRVNDATHTTTVTDESAMAQLIGVGILEFGVILHRFVKPFTPLRFAETGDERPSRYSVLIGLTLAVNENFKVLFVVIVFHRKHLSF